MLWLTDEQLSAWHNITKPLDPAAIAQVDDWLADLKPTLDKAVRGHEDAYLRLAIRRRSIAGWIT